MLESSHERPANALPPVLLSNNETDGEDVLRSFALVKGGSGGQEFSGFVVSDNYLDNGTVIFVVTLSDW